MTRPHVAQEILDAAHARRAARAAADWAEADRLKALIEAAGWRVVDRGGDFALVPAHPANVVEDGRVRYGASGEVPSRLGEPATAPATVIVRATDDPAAFDRTISAIRARCAPGTQVVVVADCPSESQVAALGALQDAGDAGLEIVWTSARLGPAAAINAGLRRSVGAIVAVLEPGVEPAGDLVAALAAALADPAVAVAGEPGLAGSDLRRLEAVTSGEADAIDLACLAFRRSDAAAMGPIDEHLRTARILGTWCSLALRDGGEEQPPRRAVVLDGLTLGLPAAATGAASEASAERRHQAKRDTYRLIDRFRARPDLLRSAARG